MGMEQLWAPGCWRPVSAPPSNSGISNIVVFSARQRNKFFEKGNGKNAHSCENVLAVRVSAKVPYLYMFFVFYLCEVVGMCTHLNHFVCPTSPHHCFPFTLLLQVLSSMFCNGMSPSRPPSPPPSGGGATRSRTESLMEPTLLGGHEQEAEEAEETDVVGSPQRAVKIVCSFRHSLVLTGTWKDFDVHKDLSFQELLLSSSPLFLQSTRVCVDMFIIPRYGQSLCIRMERARATGHWIHRCDPPSTSSERLLCTSSST